MNLVMRIQIYSNKIVYYAIEKRTDGGFVPPIRLIAVAHEPNWIEQLFGITFEKKCKKAKEQIESKIAKSNAEDQYLRDCIQQNKDFLNSHPDLYDNVEQIS